ncbi:site-specific tyrosine recombinase XerC [Rhodanobacter sp. A1T4]|uniref:site-specific tyrosine recombinase XerC n=1 Tax=Rhodanobacter sp. A1T4 TaxID=2723087 RepID=UPI00161CAED0|nr:site-specific tyrosine recombinase XerC [Rhodanobacter sp. A1T4]MBB6249431.1 integrase/recombinase XerD [Rhodanobacter sp. A1T4]
MPRKGQHTPRVPIGDVRDPDSLYHTVLRFGAWQREKNYSEKTIEAREIYLRYFVTWCDARGLRRPQEITKPILERYQRYLFLHRKKDGQPLSTRSQHTRIVPVRALFKWLARYNHILYNPASDLELPRLEHRLPKHVLTVGEAEAVMAVPDLATPTGLRDRAMLETLYSTGIRRMELIGIHVHDLDTERGTLMVRQGKGRKDRMVPIGERALAWIGKYRDDVRPQLASGGDDGTLFLTHLSEAFTPNRLTQLVREHVDAAKLIKRGSCHLFRHTMATLMLENGADIRFIQAMLGHVSLNTTQIYTQVSIRQLKAIHTATHPGRMPVGRAVHEDAPDTDRDTLLATLDAEALEETLD